MPEVNFKFDVNQKVKTVLGEVGFISTNSTDGHSNECYVRFKEGKGGWFEESQLTPEE